ncbi:hypothetical protein FVB9288_02880 [Flavobacterium sp. CECT 9288]|uniref:hypothetical protein n=1 Tax=Flavobacterium sp. CECT 9288 TaxID=2845819 RepID=UPI001E56E4A9|nr:hypothetical protein [Flavobacterium sp. CECT 9288]CAH0337136.1 hypothetical protein FVB9288_02880 [Flavobacterium sp. CECT 9288]
MYKNLISHYAFLRVLLISLILCSSCSKDNYDNYDTIKGANNVIYEIPIAELNTDNVFKAIFSKKFNNRSFENFLVNKNDYKLKSTNEFFIPEKNAVVSKTDSLISYTMLIKRNGEKVNYFENLVIQINSKNQYSANIIRYYPKSFEINQEHNSFSLIADKQLVPLNQEAGKKIKNSMRLDNQTCISVSYSVCNQGGKDHIAGERCTKVYRDVSNTVCFETEIGGGGDYGSTWGWNYSNGITFPGSGDGLEHDDNPFTITTAPIDPRLDIGIEGSIIYDESYDAFFSQIFYNNLGELKTWADQNRDLYNIILNSVINDQWSAKSLKFANLAMKFLNDNPNEIVLATEIISEILLNPSLNIDLESSFNSPFNIDRSSIKDVTEEDKKFNKIYKALTDSPAFKNLFLNLFDNNNKRFNVKFEIIENLDTSVRKIDGFTTPPVLEGRPTLIQINKQILTSTGLRPMTNIEIAKTILHECIHAYLAIKGKYPDAGGSSIPGIENMTFAEVLKATRPGTGAQHDFMYKNMVPTIQKILAEIRDAVTSSTTRATVESIRLQPNFYTNPKSTTLWKWDDYFYYLSLNGLQDTEAFKISFPAKTDQFELLLEYTAFGHKHLKN